MPPSTPLVYACLGDSITRNGPARAHAPWTARLDRALAPSRGAANRGKDSTVTSEWLTRYGATIDTFGYTGIVIGPCAFNDANALTPAATSLANILAIRDDALGRGMKVVIVTGLPAASTAGWSGAKQTIHEALRALILAEPLNLNVRICDVYPTFALAGQPTVLDPAWEGPDHDGCHIGDAGGDRLADQVLESILSFG